MSLPVNTSPRTRVFARRRGISPRPKDWSPRVKREYSRERYPPKTAIRSPTCRGTFTALDCLKAMVASSPRRSVALERDEEVRERQYFVRKAGLEYNPLFCTSVDWARRLFEDASATLPCWFCGDDPGVIGMVYERRAGVSLCGICGAGWHYYGKDYVTLMCNVGGHWLYGRPPVTEGLRRNYYSHSYELYKEGAKKRAIAFKLTKAEFSRLARQPCSYCGRNDRAMGLDRLDNECGYSVGNCISCCVSCNRLKMHFDARIFVRKAMQILHRFVGTLSGVRSDDGRVLALPSSEKGRGGSWRSVLSLQFGDLE